MGRNIQDLIRNIEKFEGSLHEVLLKSATGMALNGKALAERIIKDKGIGEKYSETYAELRESRGMQTGHVDLTFTTRMWEGMRPDDPINEGSKYFCYLGHNDQEGRNKMNWNFERYGDFIGRALEGQEDVLIEVAIDEVGRLIEDVLIN